MTSRVTLTLSNISDTGIAFYNNEMHILIDLMISKAFNNRLSTLLSRMFVHITEGHKNDMV